MVKAQHSPSLPSETTHHATPPTSIRLKLPGLRNSSKRGASIRENKLRRWLPMVSPDPQQDHNNIVLQCYNPESQACGQWSPQQPVDSPWPSAHTICSPSCQHEETVPGGEDLASRTRMPRLLEETDNFNHKAIFGRPQARRESPHGPGLKETRQLAMKDHFPLIPHSCSLLGLSRDLLTSPQ